jgi:hypothetical protein
VTRRMPAAAVADANVAVKPREAVAA